MHAPRANRYLAAAALALLCGAALAAACAHLAIDLAGDVLLAHDTYDGVGHDARSVFGAAGLAAAFAAAFRLLLGALDGGSTARRRLGELRRDLLPRLGWRFVGATVAGAILALVAMEIFDQRAAGRPIDDLGDLLGGSVALGLTIVTLAGALVATLLRVTLRWLFAVGVALSLAVAQFVRRCRTPLVRRWARLRPLLARAASAPLAHRLAKRGPPLGLVSAT